MGWVDSWEVTEPGWYWVWNLYRVRDGDLCVARVVSDTDDWCALAEDDGTRVMSLSDLPACSWFGPIDRPGLPPEAKGK